MHINSEGIDDEDYVVRPRPLQPGAIPEPPGPRTLINNTPATPTNFATILEEPKLPALPSLFIQPTPAPALVRKLRWANIGWNYHWGTKQYDFSKGKGVIDDELRNVCKHAVGSVKWESVFGGLETLEGWGEDNWQAWNESYGKSFCSNLLYDLLFLLLVEPDAGIVNFYQTKVSISTLFSSLLTRDIGHSYGTCRSFGSLCDLSTCVYLVSIFPLPAILFC